MVSVALIVKEVPSDEAKDEGRWAHGWASPGQAITW